jgi:hypothetical protein
MAADHRYAGGCAGAEEDDLDAVLHCVGLYGGSGWNGNVRGMRGIGNRTARGLGL